MERQTHTRTESKTERDRDSARVVSQRWKGMKTESTVTVARKSCLLSPSDQGQATVGGRKET